MRESIAGQGCSHENNRADLALLFTRAQAQLSAESTRPHNTSAAKTTTKGNRTTHPVVKKYIRSQKSSVLLRISSAGGTRWPAARAGRAEPTTRAGRAGTAACNAEYRAGRKRARNECRWEALYLTRLILDKAKYWALIEDNLRRYCIDEF
jgi:hypothetical protein